MPVEADCALLAGVIRPFLASPPRHLGLAVSGGSDSMAMLWLIAPWAKGRGISVSVATIDHGLRAEARAEAEFVGRVCSGVGVPHTILEWRDWDGKGNLQGRARAARVSLLVGWAKERGIDALAFGHTMDDQAETVLMRLARGSGVDGLSGMAVERERGGLRWIRPLLSLRREVLREFLRRNGWVWVEDPSNEDEGYERVRVRKALSVLGPLGIDAEGLTTTAKRLSLASDALARFGQKAAKEIATIEAGDVVLERKKFDDLPAETQFRLLADAIRWVGGSVYRPRLNALQDALGSISEGQRSLQGCLLTAKKGTIRISREWQAVKGITSASDHSWDGRWRMDGPHDAPLLVRALGEAGIRQCPGWRTTALPRQTLLSSPAIWNGETLIAAPLAGKPEGWTANVTTDFHDFLVSH
jgi:tRNA(Ile)-lysidine synthase